MQSPSLFAEFPEDITRSILETAASTRNWNCALVSKKVKAFTEPLLYRRIELVQSSKARMELLHRTVLDHPSKETNFFAAHVKMIVCIRADVAPSHALVVLQACKGVKRVVYIPDDDTEPRTRIPEESHVFLSEVTQCAPTEMCIWAKGLRDDQRNFSGLIFRNLTHLSVVFSYEWGWEWEWNTLPLLKNLTHLSINDMHGQIAHEHVSDITQQILSLVQPDFRILVVHTSGVEGPTGPMGYTLLRRLDPRIVVASSEKTTGWFEDTFMSGMGPYFYCSLADHTADWTGDEASAHGPTGGFWGQAEDALYGDQELRQEKFKRTEQDLIAVLHHMAVHIWNKSPETRIPIPSHMSSPQFIVGLLNEIESARPPHHPDDLRGSIARAQINDEVNSAGPPQDVA